MSTIIEEIRILDLFRPAEPSSFLKAHMGEPITIEVDFRIQDAAVPQSDFNVDDGMWILFRPTIQEAGIEVEGNNGILSNEPIFAGMFEGDEITITGTNGNDGVKTIIEIVDDYTILVNGTTTREEDATPGVLYLSTPFQGIKYFYNFIENDESTNFESKVDGETQRLVIGDADHTNLSPQNMAFQGEKSYQIFGATIEGRNGVTTAQSFTIKHTTVLTPVFLAGLFGEFEDGNTFTFYDLVKCLRNVIRLEVNRDISDPNDFQEIIWDEVEGNTGGREESFNGNSTNYFVDGYTIERLSDNVFLDEMELAERMEINFKVKNTVDTPFSNANTKTLAQFNYLPTTEEQYQKNGRTLHQNFVYDYGFATVGGVTVNGLNNGSNLQAIETIQSTFISSSEINVKLIVDFGSEAQSIINEDGFKNYQLSIITENHALTKETSDKAALFVDVDTFFVQLTTTNLISNDIRFLQHRHSTYGSGKTTLDAFPVDDIVAYNKFSIDFDGLESDGINITSIKHECLFEKGGEKDIVVESNTYVVSATQFEEGFVPILDFEKNRPFQIADGDFRKLVQVKRDPSADSGTTKGFYATYPFFIRWENWEALNGVDDPAAGVYDPALPNNGINHYWYRYQTLGYTFKYKTTFNIVQNGVPFTQSFEGTLTLHPFNDNPDWGNESIKSYDIDTAQEIQNGGTKYLQSWKDTKLISTFDKVAGTEPLIEDVDIVFWAIPFEGGNINNVRRFSSFYDASGNTWFKGELGVLKVVKDKTGSVYTGECLTDKNKIPSPDKFGVYSRLYEPEACPPNAILEDVTLDCMLTDVTLEPILED